MVTITLDETIDSKLLRKKMDRKMHREWKTAIDEFVHATYTFLIDYEMNFKVSFRNNYVDIGLSIITYLTQQHDHYFLFRASICRDVYFNDVDARKITTDSLSIDVLRCDPIAYRNNASAWNLPWILNSEHHKERIRLWLREYRCLVDGSYI